MRTYNYESEVKCDGHVGIFMRAIDAARDIPGRGFAAIKVCGGCFGPWHQHRLIRAAFTHSVHQPRARSPLLSACDILLRLRLLHLVDEKEGGKV